MERHDSEEADFETACNKLADLSVCEPERSPLKGIPHDSPRLEATTSPLSLSTRPDCRPLHRTLKSSESELEHDRDAQVRFNKLVKKAKLLSQEGKVQEALELNKKALQIHHHEKLARRIAKMEEYLKNYGGEDEEDETEGGMVQLGSDTGFFLHKDLTAKLYNHQKEGVLWLWRLHRKNKGGILGDDMGLGKTIQIIAFLSGLFDMDKVQTVMIVLPVSVMVNWEKEFNKWAPGIPVHSFHGTSKRERERTLNRVQRRGGVMLTTYGMVLTSWEQLSNYNGRDFVWDYVILDEGHKIKNPSKTTKAIHGVAARHRIILSGTPIQNNLKELWTLFDWVHQGALLGTLRTFKMEFENPIIRARERDATGGEKRLGMEMAQTLKTIIDPYFLRRTKTQVKEEEKDAGAKGRPHPKSIKMPTMTFKNDFVVWLYLSDTQLKIYRDFLELDSVKELLMSKKSPLVALTVLKKICDHPRLLSLRACHQLGMHGQGMVEDELELPSSLESAATKIELLDDSVLVGEAGKMSVLLSLLDQLRQDGHRALIFSQSRKILDIIQKVLRNQGHKVMRLDGTVKGLTERDELVQKFQRNTSYSVFLLTTQVGGVGLTLTAADRVIIYDPSWNPATDAQAVDRIFRIGQTKNVVVYRLITCGTVEEKIYRRQIFKDSITRQTTGNAKDPYRYFTKHELRELFQLEEPRFSNTQRQLDEMHGLHRRRDPELDDHIAFLHSLDIFGISDHDLMFSQENPDDEMEEEVELTPAENMPAVTAQHQDYILHRVQKAKEIIERESSVPGTMEQRMKTGFPAVSVYSASEGRALMSSIPVFQPCPADSQRLMLNRPGSSVTVFQPRPSDTSRQMLNRPAAAPAKPPQEIIVYPPKPVKPDVKSDVSNTSVGSSTSEPIDLTLDDDDVRVAARKNPSSSSWASSSDGDSGPAEDVMLPKIEKRRTEDRRARWEVQKEGADRMADSHAKLTASPSTQVPTQRPPSPKAAPQSPTSVPQSPKAAPQSLTSVPQSPKASELQDCKPPPPPCTTPRGKVEGLVEEELIISPNSYTPLLATRQKRRRMVDSPVVALEKALAASVLVEESPETTRASATPSSGDAPLSVAERNGDDDSQASNEIASFLAEDDLVEIQESFIEEEAETCSLINREAGDKGDGSASDASEPSRASEDASPIRMMKNKRRSVCRRVAVIESSEDEEEDEENKENIHPSFCSSSYRSRQTEEEEEEEEEERADREREAEEDQEYDDDEVDGTNETDEMDGADEVGEEEAGSAEAREEADGSVVVYDESMSEDREDEEEGAESEEEQEEEEEEEEIDKELVAELLKDGKHFYKQQRYPEALAKCEVALALLPDPQLQAMVDKIRRKIETGL